MVNHNVPYQNGHCWGIHFQTDANKTNIFLIVYSQKKHGYIPIKEVLRCTRSCNAHLIQGPDSNLVWVFPAVWPSFLALLCFHLFPKAWLEWGFMGNSCINHQRMFRFFATGDFSLPGWTTGRRTRKGWTSWHGVLFAKAARVYKKNCCSWHVA